MVYHALLRHQWTCFWRSFKKKRYWLTALVVAPLVLYIMAVLLVLGFFFDPLLDPPNYATGPLVMLNDHLLNVFIAAFGVRFFFQRPPTLAIEPYLHLPIRRSHLVRYFQTTSLWSVHNLLPLLFLVPFWFRFVAPFDLPNGGAVLWLIGVLLCLFLSNYLNTLVRLIMDRQARLFAILALMMVTVQIADQMLNTLVFERASSWFFDELALGSRPLFVLLFILTVASVLVSNHTLIASLRGNLQSSAQTRQRLLPVALNLGRSSVRDLILLELKLMWRNRRAKQYLYISLFVSTAYTALLLSDLNPLFGNFMAALTGLFASGVFALNYGQLMFAWESRAFDGLLTRNITPQQMVLAKFVILMLSCVVLFFTSLPLFVWLASDLLPLHVAFLFYNCGVTSALMLLLAVRNRRRVNPGTGGFFAYEGFSILHWLWLLPTVTPPTLLLFFFGDQPETAYSTIALMGLGGMLMIWVWSMGIARLLVRRKYIMAAGFRSNDR